MKQLICPLVLAAALAVLLILGSAPPAHAGDWPDTCGNNKSHHAYFGHRGYYDRILYVNHSVKSGSFLRKQSYDVQIPTSWSPRNGTITYVEAIDQYRNGKGGCAFLRAGGPGYPYVILHLKSQRGEGVNFIINVFGH